MENSTTSVITDTAKSSEGSNNSNTSGSSNSEVQAVLPAAGAEVSKDQSSKVFDEFERFMSTDFSDSPAIADVLAKEWDGLPSYKDILNKHTTEEGKKLIANLRSSYTKKTQELAQAKRDLQKKEAEILAEKERLYSGSWAKQAVEKASADTSSLDPYVEEDLKKIIEIETAKRHQEMLKPYQEEIKQQKAVLEVQNYIEAHPELKTDAYKEKMVPLLHSRPELDLDTARLIVKGMLADEGIQAMAVAKAIKDEQKGTARSTLSKVVNPASNVAGRPPKGLSGVEAAEWFRSNRKAN